MTLLAFVYYFLRRYLRKAYVVIFSPEEFSIQSTIKRLDIFEEDRQRILKSAWLAEEFQKEDKLFSPPGVFDFYQDWSDAINIDLQHLTTAVDKVLGNQVENQNEMTEMTNSDYLPPVNDVARSAAPRVPDIKPEQLDQPVIDRVRNDFNFLHRKCF